MCKENCYRQLKLFLLIFSIVMLIGGKATAALPSMLPVPGGWTDSLKVSVVDSFVQQIAGDSYLRFTIVVERKNANWNNKDTILGNSDLYFFANLAAFDGDPEFVDVHDSLFVSNVATIGSSQARLQISGRQWAGRMQIALTRRDEGNDLLETNVVSSSLCPNLLRLTLNKPDTLCKVKWKLRTPLAVHTGIRWDAGHRGATGLQSLGGNPILEDLRGEIPTLPMSILNVDTLPESFYVCEGSALEVAVHAEATGDGPQFAWYDSIPGKNSHFLDPTRTLQQYTESGKNYSYSYRFSAAGDTLYIDQVPGCIDSIYFACVVSAPSIGATPVYTVTRLYVRDSIWGFISGASDALTPNIVDTVSFCEGEEGLAVRFNIFGPSLTELSEIDSIWFEYRTEAGDGYLVQDTIVFKVPNDLNSRPNPNKIDGYSVFWFPATLEATGRVFINRIWTRYCENAAPATKYDTIYIEQGTYQVLDRLTVMTGGSIIMDSVNSPLFASNLPESIVSLKGLGTVPSGLIALPFRYQAGNTPGLDTVIYKMDKNDKCSWMIREVDVQDWKYVKVKVFLEGPYVNDDSMRCLLTYTRLNTWTNIPRNQFGSHYISPYDSLDILEINQLRKVIKEQEDKGQYFVDWINVELREVDAIMGYKREAAATRTVLLRTDGVICDTTGKPGVAFKDLQADKYFVVIRHRNHLGAMSASAITLEGQLNLAPEVDFTDITQVMNNNPQVGNLPEIKLSTLIYGLYGGNVIVSSNSVQQVISAADEAKVKRDRVRAVGMGYNISDLNFDGLVTANPDERIVSKNRVKAYYEKF